MVPVLRSLDRITTGYSVFERDQVLTHDQLNSVADYADDQTRLTRVRLLGVGIACGLRVSTGGGGVTLSKGVGVTTDGDLVSRDADVVYDRFRAYDRTRPAYPPLYAGGDVGGDMLPVFELVPLGQADDRARPLAEFAQAAGRTLDATAALLLMESHLHDDDLCSGTDCDNLGREAVHTPRLLVLDRAAAGPLREALVTAHDAFAALPAVSAARAVVPPQADTVAEIAAVYRTAADVTLKRLLDALPRLVRAGAPFLDDALPADGGAGWRGRLAEWQAHFAGTAAGVQAWWGFLRDLADAYGALRDALFGERSVCAPPAGAFPKHLLLGDLAPGADPAANRTGFYPSPVVTRPAGDGALAEARFLARTLDALVAAFRPETAANDPVRVTPSHGDDRPLAERAIPAYYRPDAPRPVHEAWSWQRTRRGMARHAYAYHATRWGAEGAAVDPLGAPVTPFTLFRIEGHVGKSVQSVVTALERLVRERNLPFAVRAVMLAPRVNRPPIIVGPRPKFTDLHQLHFLLRQDVVTRLGEAQRFGTALRDRVEDAVRTNTIPDASDENEGVQVRADAVRLHKEVTARADTSMAALAKPYAEYRAAPVTWQRDVGDTMAAAGEFKRAVGPVSRTEFVTPFDSLIAATHVNWLPWLDEILKQRDDKQEERLLYSVFAGRHWALEHMAGVPRGGTFVVVYESNGTVWGDLALPYWCDDGDDDLVEPALPDPGIRPPRIVDDGIKVVPSRATFFDRKWQVARPQLEERLDTKLDAQKVAFNAFKDSYLNVFKDSIGIVKSGQQPVLRDRVFADQVLDSLVRDNSAKAGKVDALRNALDRPDVDPGLRELYTQQVADAERELARSVRETADYASRKQIDVADGSEGRQALEQVTGSLQKVRDAGVVTETNAGLKGIQERTQNPLLGRFLGGFLQR